ncbi:MAG: adenylate kinase [Bdellovibrionaceae bacterium]|nr:adenylate kinase [Pseudobdellovibrionaceae bacterium]
MSLVLFGPPGAGKGTQSDLMLGKTKMMHMSTGNLFRDAIKNKTPLGVEAQSYVDAGKLVPDSVVIGLVREFLEKNKVVDFIFDGFPRTMAQAEALENQIKEVGAQPIAKALFLEVPHNVLMERLGGRRVCKNCGAVYHAKLSPPKKEGVCDKCGGEVYQRKDDAPDAIETRLEAYEKSTAPLKEYYQKKGLFISIDGVGGSTDVFERIRPFLKN